MKPSRLGSAPAHSTVLSSCFEACFQGIPRGGGASPSAGVGAQLVSGRALAPDVGVGSNRSEFDARRAGLSTSWARKCSSDSAPLPPIQLQQICLLTPVFSPPQADASQLASTQAGAALLPLARKRNWSWFGPSRSLLSRAATPHRHHPRRKQ